MKKLLIFILLAQITCANTHLTIVIGSTNPSKVAALEEVLPLYDFLAHAQLIAKKVPSNVSEQPISLAETVQGAQNRAMAAAAFGDIGVGIENGLCNIPGTDRYFDVGVCCIYMNGKFIYGLSAGYEIPSQLYDYVFNHHYDLSKAFYLAGITDHEHIGTVQGGIGILTNNRITRKDSLKEAIITALAQIEHSHLYK